MFSGLVGLLAAALVSIGAAVPSLPTDTDVDYQLGGAARAPANVGIVVRDREEKPQAGRFNVCYVNGFQTQEHEKAFWLKRKNLILQDRTGEFVVDEDWGEFLLDLRTKEKRTKIAKIVTRWTKGCAKRGFEAVEYDNLDSYTRSHGLMKKKQALAFARLLTRGAHKNGLAAGQKNLAGYDGRKVGFDFAVSEECGTYDECGAYVDDFGDQVLMIEYVADDFEKTCELYGATHPVVLRDRNLSPEGVHRYC